MTPLNPAAVEARLNEIETFINNSFGYVVASPEHDSRRWMIATCHALLAELARTQNAIRRHRDTRGDDRCWRDDDELYASLPEGYAPPARDTSVELERCRRYVESRHNPATVYVSPQRRIEELEAELAQARAAVEVADSLIAHVDTLPEVLFGVVGAKDRSYATLEQHTAALARYRAAKVPGAGSDGKTQEQQ